MKRWINGWHATISRQYTLPTLTRISMSTSARIEHRMGSLWTNTHVLFSLPGFSRHTCMPAFGHQPLAAEVMSNWLQWKFGNTFRITRSHLSKQIPKVDLSSVKARSRNGRISPPRTDNHEGACPPPKQNTYNCQIPTKGNLLICAKQKSLKVCGPCSLYMNCSSKPSMALLTHIYIYNVYSQFGRNGISTGRQGHSQTM